MRMPSARTTSARTPSSPAASVRRRTALGAGAAALALVLSGCGAGGAGDSSAASAAPTPDPAHPVVVRVGASPVPHAQILEFVDEHLAKDAGIDLEIQEFDDYQLPNTALSEGKIDANYYMHEPFFEAQVRDRNLKMEHGAGVHSEPYALFSRRHDAVAAIPDGATIAITNDPGNQPRALKLLEKAGLLTNIGEDASALTLMDEQNPKGLNFQENQPEILVQIVDDPEVDAAIINGNYFIQAGMSLDEALDHEDASGTYANFLAWREGEKTPAVTKLDELLHSPEVKEYIEQTWPSGDVIPAF